MKLFAPSLEDCITVCAQYNARYQYKQDKGVKVAGGLCKSVTIVKKRELSLFCFVSVSPLPPQYGWLLMYVSWQLEGTAT